MKGKHVLHFLHSRRLMGPVTPDPTLPVVTQTQKEIASQTD